MSSYFWPPQGGSSGVSSVNLVTGAVTLVGGTGVVISPSGQNITISSTDLAVAVTSINADITTAQTLSVGTTGTDFNIVDAGGGSHVFELPTASATNRGALSSSDWSTFNGKQASGSYITALTGDGTASGPGSSALTLATVNSNTGSFNLANITVNGKGLVTAASAQSTTGTGAVVLANTPTLITPVIGAATGTSLNLSGLTASYAVVTDASKNLASLAYTSLNTGSTLVSRDVNGNSAFVNIIITGTSTVTSGQTITMTAGSGGFQTVTGSSNIQFNLPVATNLLLIQSYTFINSSTGTITVNKQDGSTLVVSVPAGGSALVSIINNGTANGTWYTNNYLASSATSGTSGTTVPGTFSAGTTVTGTQLISTVSTGTAPLTVTSTTQVANLTASSVPASGITGTTLASNVVTSSLTTVGTIATGVWQGTTIGSAYGGNPNINASYTFVGSTTIPSATMETLSSTYATYTKIRDAGSNFNTTTGVYTAPIAGMYRASNRVSVTNSSATTGSIAAYITQGGSSSRQSISNVPFGATSASSTAQVTDCFYCSASDTLTLGVYQSNGSSIALINSGAYNSFSIEFVGT